MFAETNLLNISPVELLKLYFEIAFAISTHFFKVGQVLYSSSIII
jgi:hypothetical protein